MFAGVKAKLSGCCSIIEDVSVTDVRFPTSLEAHGSDAMHKDPDYSAAYVVLTVSGLEFRGHGFAFTLGRGTDVVASAIRSLVPLLLKKPLLDIFTDFGGFWRALTSESQLRWIGPEKGAVHLAVAAIVNALWDLWGKIEGKPVWKLLCDMSPSEIVSLVDFRYITDAITKEEALEMLQKMEADRSKREEVVLRQGYPAYTTSIGWLGYSNEKIKALCKEAIQSGFTQFKIKVGQDLADDVRRCEIVRKEIGWDVPLMMDSNQRWEVEEAIGCMTKLAHFKPRWIEEPTSPDDVLGNLRISNALREHGVGVALGEACHNRVMFKQLLASGAMQFCQIDACRLGGVNEIVAVILMAGKFGVPVCPHAGGVGLCEMVCHLAVFDYVCVSGTMEGRVLEYVDHLHEHFVDPVALQSGSYLPPRKPGYSTEMKPDSIAKFRYPDGPVWQEMQLKTNLS